MGSRNKAIHRWKEGGQREIINSNNSMCLVEHTRTREVIEVLEEAIPMPPGEVEVAVVDTRMGGLNLMIMPVETVTKGVTTTTEEGDVVVVVEEMTIHTTTTTTKTLMLVSRLSLALLPLYGF